MSATCAPPRARAPDRAARRSRPGRGAFRRARPAPGRHQPRPAGRGAARAALPRPAFAAGGPPARWLRGMGARDGRGGARCGGHRSAGQAVGCCRPARGCRPRAAQRHPWRPTMSPPLPAEAAMSSRTWRVGKAGCAKAGVGSAAPRAGRLRHVVNMAILLPPRLHRHGLAAKTGMIRRRANSRAAKASRRVSRDHAGRTRFDPGSHWRPTGRWRRGWTQPHTGQPSGNVIVPLARPARRRTHRGRGGASRGEAAEHERRLSQAPMPLE